MANYFCCLVTKSYSTFCDLMRYSIPAFPVLQYFPDLLKFISTASVILSNHLILFQPLHDLPSIFPNIRIFPVELVFCIGWPMYRSFSFSISPSNEYSGLISIRIDWFDLSTVKGILRNLLPHQNLFFGTQPSLWPITSLHDYWKNHSFVYIDLCL